jgi:zinc transport system substrate-binding protein
VTSRYLKIFGTVLILTMLCGCGQPAPTASSAEDLNKPLVIATSFYPMYIFTLNITQDIPNVRVINMTAQVKGCLHDYAVTPADLKNLEEARIFVVNGAGMESFMDKISSQMPGLKVVTASEGIQLIKGQGEEGENPHVWVSISNAKLQVKNISDQLSLLDPENSAQYQSNTAVYLEKLETERNKMHQLLDGLSNRDIITFHEAFPYFAGEFNLNIAGVIEREPGSEPNARELAAIIEKVNSLKVRALFVEPQYSAKAAETIAEATGAHIFTLDPVVTGPLEADAYINIMDRNLRTLQEALK